MRTERVDVCVIGSGAGGGVVAYEAARRGLRTLVLERGPYVRADEMSANEAEMIPRLYKDGALQTSTSDDLFILQGSCVGGSTVVSNMVLMRADDGVFSRWQRRGAGIDVAGMRAAYDVVEKQLEAKKAAPFAISKSARLFEEGARSIGLSPQKMLKAVGACHACGNCNIGCTFDTKKSALATYIPWAEAEGARVLAEANVDRIRVRRGRVDQVEATVGPEREQLRVHARAVVVAAGAIGSSALLLASGIARNVGTRVSFDMGAMIVADFDEALDAYDADQRTIYLKTNDFLISPTHHPPMSAALSTPGWMDEHADLMRRSRNLAYASATVATEPTGRVVMSRWSGHEETRFRATASDMHRLREGLKTIARVFFAAGAKRVFLPTEKLGVLANEGELGKIDETCRAMRDMQCASAHPQGGNPISDDPAIGAVDSSLAVHGIDGLFVCDASVFPDAVGADPMHTIFALAHDRAPGILARA